MNFQEGRTSRALIPFTEGTDLPYTVEMEDGSLVRVTEVRPKAEVVIGGPTRRDSKHLIDQLAGAWVGDRLVIGARWLCGATSIGARVYATDRLEEFYAPYFKNDTSESIQEMVCLKCRSRRDGSDGPCVYRVFDKSGQRLLYIGSTKSWPDRRGQHRSNTWWWQLAKSVELTHYPTIAEARAAEKAAIQSERPQMNVVHNRSVGAS